MKAEELFPGRAAIPGMHAFIVGVSEYPHLLAQGEGPTPWHHLGLRKLSSAATAAHRLYCYLVERADHFAVPLATCRLLLSPSPPEVPRLADLALRANMENFDAAANAWRRDARTDPWNVTLFYFAGHGLQRTRGGQVLLLEDFGASDAKILRRCLEASNVVDGMASTSAQDTMARTQLYFFDACRTLPPEVLKYDRLDAETIWDLPPRPDPQDPYLDNRFAPVFYTCEPGSEAFGIEGTGSVFGEALLRCLKGGAGIFNQQTRQWSVTVSSLSRALEPQLTIINREYQTRQMFRVTDAGPDAPLHQLDGPPEVEIEITLNPPEKRPHAKVFVIDEKQNPVFDVGAPVLALHRKDVPAGTYDVSAIPDVRLLAEGANQQEVQRIRWLLRADPPFSVWPLHLE